MQNQYSLRSPAVKRLMREAQELSQPTAQYFAQPLDDNLFEWHFTLRGPAESDFDGGLYHGRIVLPPDYPMKPPSIIILTPNGRFEVNKKICLSISGYHPESWQPSWSIRTALLAIIGFMPSHGNGAIGSLDYTTKERQILAKRSLSWKCPTCGDIHGLLPPVSNENIDDDAEAKKLAAQINFKAEKETVTSQAEKCQTSSTVSPMANTDAFQSSVTKSELVTTEATFSAGNKFNACATAMVNVSDSPDVVAITDSSSFSHHIPLTSTTGIQNPILNSANLMQSWMGYNLRPLFPPPFISPPIAAMFTSPFPSNHVFPYPTVGAVPTTFSDLENLPRVEENEDRSKNIGGQPSTSRTETAVDSSGDGAQLNHVSEASNENSVSSASQKICPSTPEDELVEVSNPESPSGSQTVTEPAPQPTNIPPNASSSRLSELRQRALYQHRQSNASVVLTNHNAEISQSQRSRFSCTSILMAFFAAIFVILALRRVYMSFLV